LLHHHWFLAPRPSKDCGSQGASLITTRSTVHEFTSQGATGHRSRFEAHFYNSLGSESVAVLELILSRRSQLTDSKRARARASSPGALQLQKCSLHRETSGVATECAVASHHSVTRNDHRKRVGCAGEPTARTAFGFPTSFATSA